MGWGTRVRLGQHCDVKGSWSGVLMRVQEVDQSKGRNSSNNVHDKAREALVRSNTESIQIDAEHCEDL